MTPTDRQPRLSELPGSIPVKKGQRLTPEAYGRVFASGAAFASFLADLTTTRLAQQSHSITNPKGANDAAPSPRDAA